ncbi:MAG TPA: S9 family peptidase [Terriglobales bacterium]|nr:S9 family peptidase [Terriglobales bacterium]
MNRRHAWLALVCLLTVVQVLPAVAQTAADNVVIPRKVLFGNPERTSPRISPDGARLAYLAPDSKGVLNVWVRSVGKTDDEVVTSDKKRGIRSFLWQFDSQHVLYIQDRDGDENWHLYQTDLKTKMTRDLTPFEGIQAQVAEYFQQFPDTILAALNVRDRRFHDVYRINLKTGAVEMEAENPGDVAGWTADNNLRVRGAQATTPDGGTIIRVRGDEKSPWRELMKWGPDETLGGVFAFSPDNRSLWVGTSVGANATQLLEVDVDTGKTKVVAGDPQYDVDDVMINNKTHALEGVSFIRSKPQWALLDKSVAADFEVLSKVRDGVVSVVGRDRDDKNWVVRYVSDRAPVYFYSYDRASKKATLLFSNQPKLEGYKLAAMEPISFKARDGMEIYGYLTLPVGVEPKNLPMVMWVHGGPWARDVWGLSSYAQWFANRGYAVLQVNFRGSTGYGKKYLNAGDREWGGTMHTDLLDGKEWAVKRGVVNADKVCIMGGSYGGYATLVGVTFTPDAFACGVDIVGPSNLNTLLKTIPPYWATIKAVFDKRMGTGEEFLNSRSPLFKADRIKAPLLIGQGANDPRVNKAESDQIVAAMKKNHKPVEYIVFPDEGHGFARPENREAFNAAAETFLAKTLGGRVQPPTEQEAKLLEQVTQK